jgi:hypothetical protein
VHPSLHDCVHARHPDAGLDDLDALGLQDGVEGGRVADVPVADQEHHPGALLDPVAHLLFCWSGA